MYTSSGMLAQGVHLVVCHVFGRPSLVTAQHISSGALLIQLPQHLNPPPRGSGLRRQLLSHSLPPVAEGQGPFVSRCRHNNTEPWADVLQMEARSSR